ncbi:hypothetical protein K435DRAFT_790030 [Dendrothele bispora CBS 962.96]|uniref:Uncharacterized protein n=1 Tax=Dendrothele bispora (strain CBS 962.96) TaxID=1314807 RepID=A0A4S8MSD0_DENBC|nr:hypothetical protein K435DRAFT_790030 [Dendrothele bispora CBS 962.96]
MTRSNFWNNPNFTMSPDYLATLSGIKGQLSSLQALRFDCVTDPKDDKGRSNPSIEEKEPITFNASLWIMTKHLRGKLHQMVIMTRTPGCNWTRILREANQPKSARFISQEEGMEIFPTYELVHESLVELTSKVFGENTGLGISC